jgi:DNA modification methylase
MPTLEKFCADRVLLFAGDCLELLAQLPPNSVHACVTDPPYGLKFMGRAWDHGVPSSEVWSAVLRVLKPGAHLLAFSGTRTYHRLGCAIEDGGFEIFDMVQWLYGQGMPKGKNFDGAWDGWGTTLKPASEPIALARKPLDGTFENNLAAHGVGALNIDACRVFVDQPRPGRSNVESRSGLTGTGGASTYGAFAVRGNIAVEPTLQGRWPANLVHDGSDEVLAGFPESKGQQGDVRGTEPSRTGDENTACYGEFGRVPFAKREDAGSAARFFYCAKAAKSERGGSKHPTIKPLALMRWLVRLVTPPNGVVLDPFAGTGTTGQAAHLEGFRAILCESDTGAQADIRKRLA